MSCQLRSKHYYQAFNKHHDQDFQIPKTKIQQGKQAKAKIYKKTHRSFKVKSNEDFSHYYKYPFAFCRTVDRQIRMSFVINQKCREIKKNA